MKKKSKLLIDSDKFLSGAYITEGFAVNTSLSLLFALSVVYFYFFGNGNFFYQENSSLFIFTKDYLQKFTAKPGGLLTYAGNFLTQGYFSSLYGSFVVSIVLILFGIIFLKIYRRLSDERSFSVLFMLVPSCSLFLLETHYDIFVQHSLGYLLVVFWFLMSVNQGRTITRFILIGLFPLIYYLVGSYVLLYLGMYLLFCLIYEKGTLRYSFIGFLLGIALLTFTIFKDLLFLQPVSRLLGYPLFYNDSTILTRYSYLFDGVIILIPLLIKAAGLIKINRKFAHVIPLATILTLFPVTILLLLKNYDPEFTSLMQLEQSVYGQDWDAVIKQYERVPSENVIGQYYYNLALSEKDQLCERMFFGRQSFGAMSLTLPRDNEQAYRAVYFYWAIGLNGEAHHLAYELMVQHGYRPENIKLLVKTELINGNYKIAGKYIDVLKKTFHYKNWAEKYEKMLYRPELISADRELGEKIRLLPGKDFFIATDDATNIDLLLADNPDNKRAFEYKMARFLLEKDLVEITAEAKKMKDRGYTHIPRHIEEAVVSLININKEYPDLNGLSISPDTDQRFIQYFSVFKTQSGNKQALEKVMKKTEKNTFWYYLQFNNVHSKFLEKKQVDNSIY